MKEARYFNVIDMSKKILRCELCPHICKLSQGETGKCGARKNIDGKLFSLVYGEFSAVHNDPIEKKPLYHFLPGSNVLSVGTVGCNLKCMHCQNYEISQSAYGSLKMRQITPEGAISLCKQYNSIGIAYTYNEPVIDYEWVLDTSVLAAKNGLKNILVTNGYINEEPLINLIKTIDAANIDIKSFKNDFYKNICSAQLGPVLRTIEIMFKQKKHIELTYLIIPGKNDSTDELKDLVDWISSISPYIPLHFSRYFPHYKMNEAPTPAATLEKARKIAMERLKYIYIGNVNKQEANRTYCPSCGAVVIDRAGYNTDITGLSTDGTCKRCDNPLSIVTHAITTA